MAKKSNADIIEKLARRIANGVFTEHARPEDWLTETFVKRIIRKHATDVLTRHFATVGRVNQR